MGLESSKRDFLNRVERLKAHAVPCHEIIAIPAQYIVIGNFSTSPDPLTILTTNKPSGLTEETFDFAVRTYAKTNKLKVSEHFGDSIVLQGNVQDLKAIKSSFGRAFSFAHIDSKSLEGFILAEDEYRRHGHIIAGSEKDTKSAPQPHPIH